jgi:hypothetical protein
VQHQGSTATVQDQVISPEETAESPSLAAGLRRYWNASVCAGLSPCEAAVFAWVFDRSIFEPRLAGSRKVRLVAVPIREIGRRYGFDQGGISKAMARLASRRILLDTPQGCRVNPRLDDWDKLSPECLAWLQTHEATIPAPHSVHMLDRFKEGVDGRQQGVDGRQQGVDGRQQAPDLLLDVRAPASDSVDFSSIPASPPTPALSENVCVCNFPETPAPALAGAREGENNTHKQTHTGGYSQDGDYAPDAEVLAKATRLAERHLREDVVNLIDEYRRVFPSAWFLTLIKRILVVERRKLNRGYLLRCLQNAHRSGDVGIDVESDYDDELHILPQGKFPAVVGMAPRRAAPARPRPAYATAPPEWVAHREAQMARWKADAEARANARMNHA